MESAGHPEGLEVRHRAAAAEVAEEGRRLPAEHPGDLGDRLLLHARALAASVERVVVGVQPHREGVGEPRGRVRRLEHLAGVERVEVRIVVLEPIGDLFEQARDLGAAGDPGFRRRKLLEAFGEPRDGGAQNVGGFRRREVRAAPRHGAGDAVSKRAPHGRAGEQKDRRAEECGAEERDDGGRADCRHPDLLGRDARRARALGSWRCRRRRRAPPSRGCPAPRPPRSPFSPRISGAGARRRSRRSRRRAGSATTRLGTARRRMASMSTARRHERDPAIQPADLPDEEGEEPVEKPQRGHDEPDPADDRDGPRARWRDGFHA